MQNSNDEKKTEGRSRVPTGVDEVLLSELHTLLLSPAVPAEVKEPIREALSERAAMKKLLQEKKA